MQTIGRYQIVHRIAVGGMAEVFLGRVVGEGGFEKVVAVKRILHHLAQNEKFIKMFMDEARISATLNHSNIAQIFEFGRAGATYFLAMEYVGGLSLRSVLRHFRKKLGQSMPTAMAAYVVSNICAGLEYAHTRCDTYGQPLRIIHRDVSPSNVLISFNGEVKLIDFGVAKAARRMQETVGGDLKGKYAYMSPEQASGQAMDHRSDLFSTGVLLFEAITGRNPFRGENDLATLSLVQQAEVPLPSSTLQGDAIQLYEICTRALERDPVRRFRSAGDMQEALELFSRRNIFGTRQMARWMKECFPREEGRVQELLRRAAEEDAPTVELAEVEAGPSTDEAQTVELPPRPAASPRAEPVPLTRGRRATPMAAPAHEIATPVGPPPRQDPSRSPTPLTPSGHSNVGKVAVPAGPPPVALPAPPVARAPARRRSGAWLHVVAFMVFAVLVGGVVFVLVTWLPERDAGSGAPIGTVRIRVEPAVGAQVFVDGELHGAMGAGEGYEIRGLLAGKHRIRLRSASFAVVESIVAVEAGRTTPLTVTLGRSPSSNEP